jgi:hypothetical protein
MPFLFSPLLHRASKLSLNSKRSLLKFLSFVSWLQADKKMNDKKISFTEMLFDDIIYFLLSHYLPATNLTDVAPKKEEAALTK